MNPNKIVEVLKTVNKEGSILFSLVDNVFTSYLLDKGFLITKVSGFTYVKLTEKGEELLKAINENPLDILKFI